MSIFGTYFIAQSIFLYIPNIYPRYAASIFAANSLARSLLAVAAILFSRPMFIGIGIDGGVSLLAGCMVICLRCGNGAKSYERGVGLLKLRA
jgi:DHA1 family multidrug resistance protein-like MFS transporter